jgi:hypothetical protein
VGFSGPDARHFARCNNSFDPDDTVQPDQSGSGESELIA